MSVRERERLRWYLKRFLETVDGSGIRDEPANSEFSIAVGEGRVVVRVVELLRPSAPPGVRESVLAFRRALVQQIDQQWSSDPDRPAVEGWVEFSGHEQTTSSMDRTNVARSVCEIVATRLPQPDGFVRLVAGTEDEVGSIPLVTPAVTVARLDEYTGSSWHMAAAPSRAGIDADFVKDALVEVAGERGSDGAGAGAGSGEAGDERWLVATLDSFRLSSSSGIPSGVAGLSVDSTYDRIWVLDPVEGRAVEPTG